MKIGDKDGKDIDIEDLKYSQIILDSFLDVGEDGPEKYIHPGFHGVNFEEIFNNFMKEERTMRNVTPRRKLLEEPRETT